MLSWYHLGSPGLCRQSLARWHINNVPARRGNGRTRRRLEKKTPLRLRGSETIFHSARPARFHPPGFLSGADGVNRMLESPFDDFFDAMPAIGAAPVQEVKEEKKDDLMSHEEQSRFSYLRQLNALKLEQKKAIHEENFERAAQLRDEIHKLEEAHKEAKESHKDGKESA